MMRFFKKTAKEIVNALGWNITRLNPANHSVTQLLSAMDKVQVDTIFDVGANIGQFAKQVRSYGFTGKIVSFEPLTSAHSLLSDAAARDPGWIIHPRSAVGNEDGEIAINIAGNSVSSSVLPMLEAHSAAAVNSGYVASERVPLIRLDSVAGQYLSVNSRPFLKIDTQGFESQVLDGAVDTLGRSRGLLMELSLVPLYDGQRLWFEMIERIKLEGFTLWAIQEGFTDPRTGRSLQVDAIFLRQ